MWWQRNACAITKYPLVTCRRGFLQGLSSFAWRRLPNGDVTTRAFETRKSMLCEAMVPPPDVCKQCRRGRGGRPARPFARPGCAVIAETLASVASLKGTHGAESAHTEPRRAGGWVRDGYIEPRGYAEEQVADLSALLTQWPRSGLEQLQPAATVRSCIYYSISQQCAQRTDYAVHAHYHYSQIAFWVLVGNARDCRGRGIIFSSFGFFLWSFTLDNDMIV